MHSVDGKIADVGAASAAKADLKPLQYDPLEPTQVLALVATIKVVLLLLLVSLTIQMNLQCFMGVSLGGHDNMVNAGVSYKFSTSDAKKQFQRVTKLAQSALLM